MWTWYENKKKEKQRGILLKHFGDKVACVETDEGFEASIAQLFYPTRIALREMKIEAVRGTGQTSLESYANLYQNMESLLLCKRIFFLHLLKEGQNPEDIQGGKAYPLIKQGDYRHNHDDPALYDFAVGYPNKDGSHSVEISWRNFDQEHSHIMPDLD